MKFSLIAAAAALVAGVNADFHVVAAHITGFGGPVGETGNHWHFVKDLSCNTLKNADSYVSHNDVSKQNGVRIVWKEGGPYGDQFFGSRHPVVVEMHTNEYHRTWYMNRDNKLVNLKGGVVGHCKIDYSVDKQCDVTAGVTRYQTLLKCTEN